MRPSRATAAKKESEPRSLAGLNPAQREAATTLEGPAVVIAGAGTGKTRTLVHRLARLVESGVPPESILLLTFTRRAAEEMISRSMRLIGGGGGRVAGGTFHSFGNMMLRRHGRAIGLGAGFTVLDQADTFELLSSLRSELGLGGRGRGFPRRETIGAIISKAVNHQRSIGDVLEREYPHLIDEEEHLVEILERYEAFKTERGLVDFDDLLCFLIRLLEESEEVRRHVHERFRYIMVDEYQDTNVLQARITRLLAGAQRNLMVVGDDAQSIYAFRGACFENLFDFHREFSEARVTKLEQNYRSIQPILDLANALMGQMSRSFQKELFTDRGGGARPLLLECMNEDEQALWVASEVSRLHREGTPLSDMAVLFRASYQAFPLEIELGRLDIPFIKYGGFRFMDAAHIKDVLAPLRVVANPADSLSLERSLLVCEGVGRTGARKLRLAAAGASDASKIASVLRTRSGRGKAKESLKRLAELFDELLLARGSPAECVRLSVEHYLPSLKQGYDDWPKRLRDIEQLADIAERYENLETLLTDLAIDPPNAATKGQVLADAGRPHGAERAGPDPEDQLVLSTMHSAKGLEWKHVFIIQALDGCIPMLGGAFDEEPESDKLDEELRLLYVAVTRARDSLAIAWPRMTRRNHGFGWADESRFLAAVEMNLFNRRVAAELLYETAVEPHASRRRKRRAKSP